MKHRTRLSIMTAALKTAEVAINDWLHVYAPELCDDASVQESFQRIDERGTLSYIAHVSQEIRDAIQLSEKGKKKT